MCGIARCCAGYANHNKLQIDATVMAIKRTMEDSCPHFILTSAMGEECKPCMWMVAVLSLECPVETLSKPLLVSCVFREGSTSSCGVVWPGPDGVATPLCSERRQHIDEQQQQSLHWSMNSRTCWRTCFSTRAAEPITKAGKKTGFKLQPKCYSIHHLR